MFRPPSLLSPQIVPTAAILLQGSRGFYVRAYRALLPPHAPDMLTVRIQVIDGTGTFTLSDSQPCRLLTSLPPRYRGQHNPTVICAITITRPLRSSRFFMASFVSCECCQPCLLLKSKQVSAIVIVRQTASARARCLTAICPIPA
jgi:hypothetical protein